MLISQPGFGYSPGRMRPLAALLVALALLSGARGSCAAPFTPPAPPAGSVAIGAEVVTVLAALPDGSEELELFLVPEGGAPIRVSAELPAGATEVRWRMPAVAARSARLVLRAGGEHAEWESAPSASFPLAPLPEGELLLLLSGHSEAGVRIVSFAGSASMLTGLLGRNRTAALAAAGELATAAEETGVAAITVPEARGIQLARGTPASLAPIAGRADITLPAQVPLRI
jgi:hypothetical protein